MLISTKIILSQLLLLTLISAHGRLLTPMPRALHSGYENDPVVDMRESDPLKATAGNDWVCRHSTPTSAQMFITAGSQMNLDFRLTARHVGDCDVSISYDWDKALNQMQWFKIANFPNCKDQGTMVPELSQVAMNRVEVTLPSWLKQGRAVVRWGWWGIHNWPTVEFFNQCSDVEILAMNGVIELPTQLQTHILPGLYPKRGNDGTGYRNEWAGESYGTDNFWLTGPACAMDSDLNNCQLTAAGTKGHLAISNSPTSTTSSPITSTSTSTTSSPITSTSTSTTSSPITSTSTSTTSSPITSTSTSTTSSPITSTSTSTTSSPITSISTTLTTSPALVCASQTYVSIVNCVSDSACQMICSHDGGVVCPSQYCQCVATTTQVTTTTQALTTQVSTSASTTTAATTQPQASTTQVSTSASTTTAITTQPQASTTQVSTSASTTTTAATTQLSTTQSISGGDQVRICYFENWARYWPGFNSEDVFEKGLDATLCTHIQYGFLAIEDNTWDLKPYDPNADLPSGDASRQSPCPDICKPGYVHDWSSGANLCEWPCGPDRSRRGFDGMLKLKEENPNMKLIASVGGWNFNDCAKTDQANTGAFTCRIFSTIAASAANSRAHALKVIHFLRLWGFDGYDVDWEYPVSAGHNNVDMQPRPADFANYISFLEILRDEFEKEAQNANDSRAQLLLTAAVGVGKSTVDESYDIPKMNNVLDLISLMTYDMNGAWETTATNFNAPLRATSMDSQLKGYPLSVEWAVDYWLAGGASADKLVLGMATYGRGWTLAAPGQNQGALSAAIGAASAGPLTRMAGYLAYSEIQDLVQNQNAVQYWDSDRQVPYIITDEGNQWIGYDDVQSLTLKTNFLMSRGLRGAMFWALELDDVTGVYSNGNTYPLLKAVKTTMNGYRLSSISTTSLPSSTTSASTSTTSLPATTTSTSTSTTSTSLPATTTSLPSSTTSASSSGPSNAVNLIGYFGNSGGCASSGCTPTFSEIPAAYNVIIMTFLNIDDNHNLNFEISSHAPVQLANLATQISTWKQTADPWGRQKMVLVSLGGQNGHWPASITDDEVVTKLGDFLRRHNLDGLDIDFESSAVQFVEKNIAAFRQLKSEGFVLCAAPEAAQGPLTAYRPILADLDWVHPQFYNNPPNAVTVPFVPQFENHSNWQSPQAMPWWLVTMDTTAKLVGLSPNQRGIAIPATPLAAGNNNDWDLNLLAAQIRVGDIRNVATWALGYDKINNWALANVIAALNNQDPTTTASTTSSSSTTLDCFDLKSTSECQAADQAWSMCSASGAWWISQCQATCNQC